MKDKLIRKENVCIIIFNKDEYGYRLNSRFKGSFSINNYYWSSTQITGNTGNSGGARTLQFIDHTSSSHNYQTNLETSTARVRAVRVF